MDNKNIKTTNLNGIIDHKPAPKKAAVRKIIIRIILFLIILFALFCAGYFYLTQEKTRTSVETIYGYLKVFPEELGTFERVPDKVIEQLNNREEYGYNTWRLPTEEEVTLLRENGFLSFGKKYMTSDGYHRRGTVLLVTDKADAATLREEENAKYELYKNILNAIIEGTVDLSIEEKKSKIEEVEKTEFQNQELNELLAMAKEVVKKREEEQRRSEEEQRRREEEQRRSEEEQRRREEEYARTHGNIYGHDYVDLGLPSGLKWATCNVGASAPEKYGGCRRFNNAERTNWGGKWRLPTRDEMEELRTNCTWEWTKQKDCEGYKITGPNGNGLFLPCEDDCYWTSNWSSGGNLYSYSEFCSCLHLNSWQIYIDTKGTDECCMIRLVTE